MMSSQDGIPAERVGRAASGLAGDPAGLAGDPDLLGEFATVSCDILAALAPDGTLLATNPAWERILGWPVDEVIGTSLRPLVHPRDRRATDAAFQRLVEHGTPLLDVENRCRTRDGEWRWISWSASVGESGRVFSCGRDVTSRTQRHLEVHTNETLLANAERIARLGSWEWEPSSELVRSSREMRRILGLDDDALLTYEGFLALVHPDDRDRFAQEVGRAVRERRAYHVEYVVQRPDGSELTLLERGEPFLQQGRPVRYIGTIQDVSEQRRSEADLRRALQVEQQASDRLRQLDQLKNSFLGAVSHELRTPLTVLQGLADTLHRHGDDLDAADRERVQRALVDQSAKLSELIHDLLDLNRLLHDGQLPIRPAAIDLGGLIRTTVAAWSHTQRVHLELTDDLWAPVDAVHLERILVNLVDNSLKYAPEGVVVVGLRPVENGVRLEVSDEGPGFPEDALERVFEPFYRVDDRHPQPGTGVGLALVSEFARLHGGRAWAENRPGGGGLVAVELPVELPVGHAQQ